MPEFDIVFEVTLRTSDHQGDDFLVPEVNFQPPSDSRTPMCPSPRRAGGTLSCTCRTTALRQPCDAKELMPATGFAGPAQDDGSRELRDCPGGSLDHPSACEGGGSDRIFLHRHVKLILTSCGSPIVAEKFR
jgi:hypothetical protein